MSLSRCLLLWLPLLACAAEVRGGSADEPVGPKLFEAAQRIARKFVADDKHERNYRFDLALEALLEMSEASGQPRYRDHVMKVVKRRGWTPKTDISFNEQSFTCLSFALYQHTNEQDWLTVFLTQSERSLKEQKRSSEGAVMHFRGRERGGGDALLIDSMQEHVARMARAGKHGGDPKFYAEAARQIELYRSIVRDPRTGLWHQGRGWLKGRPEEVSPGVWSRGHGWVLRGLSAACSEIPRERPEFRALQGAFEELGKALLERQQPGGMWLCLLDKAPSQTPYESSGTAMIATAFSRAYRTGVVTDGRYRDAAERAFRALPKYVDEGGRVLSTSPGPGPLESEQNYFTDAFPPGNDHGTFALMFAAAEAVRLDRFVNGKTPLAELLAKAQQGDAEAQYQVGRAYSEGQDIAKDQAAALEWFLKAGQRDHAKAQVSLGSIYSHGFGVKQDWTESIRWFRRAAFQGDRVAMHNLGLDYEHAHGVTRAFDEAAHWYRLGAELGQSRCQYNLGLLYEAGRGVPQSDFEACVLFTLASSHDNQVYIFGAAKAKEVAAHRDRLAEKLGADQKARLERAVKAFQMRVAVHPRQFGSPGGGVGATRGWYIWHRFDPKTWEAEVSHDPPQATYKVRVLPWATTYRLLNYGARPDQLVPGERVNLFFNPDERHARGYVVHFQDELCQMKGHGHAWQIRKLAGAHFSAQALAGEKPLEEMSRDFVIGKACATWQTGRRVEAGQWSVGDRVYLRWCLRDSRREVTLIADDASLEVLKKQEAEQLRAETQRVGMLGRLQSVDGTAVHVMIFATHWSQAGALKQGQVVRLSASGQGFVPEGETIEAKLAVRKNRGAYGSGVSDVMLELSRPDDASKLRPWLAHDTIHLLHD